MTEQFDIFGGYELVCCDVLLRYHPVLGNSRPFYVVLTVREASSNGLTARVNMLRRPKIVRGMIEDDPEQFRRVFIAAGDCGSFDDFVGKYVGQFIDEAFGAGVDF